jgi:anti-sigma factor ChrR (cupin superfamily)
MSNASGKRRCDQTDLVAVYALRALPAAEAIALEMHMASCSECEQELDSMRSVVERFHEWPTDVLRPSTSLWERLADRIAAETGGTPLIKPADTTPLPEWDEVSPGIFCKLLSTDTQSHRVCMLVRLAPGVDYPPHTHAGREELHLLDGELWIDERKLYPCVLITSTRDVLA